MAINEWSSSISYLDEAVIDKAIDRCKVTMAWPPSIAEFLDLCDEQSGVLSAQQIMDNAIRQDFSQPIVQYVYDKIGSWDFRNDSTKQLLAKCQHHRNEFIATHRLSKGLLLDEA